MAEFKSKLPKYDPVTTDHLKKKKPGSDLSAKGAADTLSKNKKSKKKMLDDAFKY